MSSNLCGWIGHSAMTDQPNEQDYENGDDGDKHKKANQNSNYHSN